MNDQKDKRQKVLDTTLEMIMEHGVQATSMSKVSKASGVAVGTIYHHFASKEAIITELYRHFKTEMLEAMQRGASFEGNVTDSFNEVILSLLDYTRKKPNALEFCETFASSPVIDKEVREEVEKKFYSFTSDFFVGLKQEGILGNISEEMLFVYLNGTVFSMVRAQNAGQINWSDEEVKQYLSLVWKGLSK